MPDHRIMCHGPLRLAFPKGYIFSKHRHILINHLQTRLENAEKLGYPEDIPPPNISKLNKKQHQL